MLCRNALKTWDVACKPRKVGQSSFFFFAPLFLCRYAPQDAQELKAALLELVASIESFCKALLLVDDSAACQKVHSVSSMLCKDSVSKIEEALAREKTKKK